MKRNQNKSQPSISSFFSKRLKEGEKDLPSSSTSVDNIEAALDSIQVQLPSTTSFLQTPPSRSPPNAAEESCLPTFSLKTDAGNATTVAEKIWLPEYFDIGDVDRRNINDITKKNILNSVLLPKQPHIFPTTEKNLRRRSFQENWIRNTDSGYPFLAYSQKEDGVYCKPCFLFFHDGVGKGKHEPPGKLVKSSFRDWKKAKDFFYHHTTRAYHKECVVLANNFLTISSGTSRDIISQLDSQRAREKEENRAAIIPIIETILFCAEQELPLRGDHDSGPLTLQKPEKRDGKFRSLLRFRANSGDENLKNHIINSRKNATYMSPDIQNEIIQTCGNIVTEELVRKINKASCFSILADETMDVSATEQLSFCVRYLATQENQTLVIREDFLGFIPIYDQSSENLSKVILQRCQELGLDMSKCVGQGYDGAANMSGHLSGVQTRIRQQYPNARYVHCASHRLNLALSKTMSVAMVRNCLGVVNEVANLFRNHANASKTLQDNISQHAPEIKRRRLIRLCETRFIERHDSILAFVELFHCICISLESISGKIWKISATASSLLAAVGKSDFLISLLVCEKLFSLTLPLSLNLQEKSLDLSSAIKHSKKILEVLKDHRENAATVFRGIFNSVSDLARETFQTELQVPRIASRQTSRANPQTATVEEYYRVTVFIPCVENLIQNLSDRFTSNEDILPSFQILLPGFASIDELQKLENLYQYLDVNMSISAVKAEYEIWWREVANIDPNTEVLKVLEKCNTIYYPTINHLLSVLATLPVTTASVERSFSTMKRVKTLPRNLMGDERLSALAMVSINWDITVNPNRVIDIMAAKTNRRLLL